MSDQMRALIDAVQDNAAATNRLADMIAAYILSDRPQLAAKFVAPNLRRPLEAYAAFDWDSIGATVTKRDQDGATLVLYQGREYKRYRSTEDDSKGIDIRFRCVIAGNVDDQNLVWATLIKFGGKPKTDSKPLRGELAERIRDAKANAPQPAAQPAAQPALQPAAQTTAQAQVATPASATPTTQQPPPPPPEPFIANVQQRNAAIQLGAFVQRINTKDTKLVMDRRDDIMTKYEEAKRVAALRGLAHAEPVGLMSALTVIKTIGAKAVNYDALHKEAR